MGFKFFHAADIHLDSPLVGLQRYPGAPLDEIRGATRQAFEKLIGACIDEHVAFLILAGDLFDGNWTDFETGLFFLDQMRKLRDKGIRVFIVRGNHDAESKMTVSLRPLSNMHVFRAEKPETVPLEEIGVAIHGQSYGKQKATEDLSKTYPPPDAKAFNIGVLHTSADGKGHDHAPYAPCTVQGLVDRNYQYWALGHVHGRRVLHSHPLIVFPGNLQGRHIKETGAKGATLVTVEDGQATEVHQDFDVLRWVQREVIISATTASDAVDQVGANLATLRAETPKRALAVRVRLSGACGAHAELVSDPERTVAEIRVQGSNLQGVWVEKVEINTQSLVDGAALRAQSTPLGELLRAFDALRADGPALQQLAQELGPLRAKLSFLDPEEKPGLETHKELVGILDDAEQLLIPLLMNPGGKK